MIIDLSTLSPAQVYFTMIQTIIPRPIAWVLSPFADGGYNLAPFSYFNAVCADPPLVLVSTGRKPGGAFKDTKTNIEQQPLFVVHIVDEDNLEAMNASSATLDHGESEVSKLGLETVPFDGFDLPRLASAKVALACSRYQVIQVGNAPQSLILGEVHRVFVDDAVIGEDAKGRQKIHADRIRPVSRLGASEYATFGEVVRLARPE